MTWRGRKTESLLLALMLLCLIAGCDLRRWDMYRQGKVKPLTESDFFSDGRSARLPVEGTVARGHLDEDEAFYAGTRNGKLVDTFPFRITGADMIRGRERYNIYCAPCHDRTGMGMGMVVQRGFARPPSFHIDRLRKVPAGHFYDTISRGFGAMPAYGAQVEPPDRWRIVAYLRALQLSQQAPLEMVPLDRRHELTGEHP